MPRMTVQQFAAKSGVPMHTLLWRLWSDRKNGRWTPQPDDRVGKSWWLTVTTWQRFAEPRERGRPRKQA